MIAKGLSPEETIETNGRGVIFSRPFGTCSAVPGIPALKRRAILAKSLRDEPARISQRREVYHNWAAMGWPFVALRRSRWLNRRMSPDFLR